MAACLASCRTARFTPAICKRRSRENKSALIMRHVCKESTTQTANMGSFQILEIGQVIRFSAGLTPCRSPQVDRDFGTVQLQAILACTPWCLVLLRKLHSSQSGLWLCCTEHLSSTRRCLGLLSPHAQAREQMSVQSSTASRHHHMTVFAGPAPFALQSCTAPRTVSPAKDGACPANIVIV